MTCRTGRPSAHLPQALAQGKVTQAEIDTAVRRVLRLKFLAGLFEHPYADAALCAQDHQRRRRRARSP